MRLAIGSGLSKGAGSISCSTMAQHIAKGEKIDCAFGWFDKHVILDRQGEGNVFGFDALLHCPIHTFDVQVGNALVMTLHKGDRVAAAIGVMTGV